MHVSRMRSCRLFASDPGMRRRAAIVGGVTTVASVDFLGGLLRRSVSHWGYRRLLCQRSLDGYDCKNSPRHGQLSVGIKLMSTFGCIVERHKGDAGVRTLSCADLFRVMASFTQITWRESLRDIEACLAANQGKLFHMDMKAPPARIDAGRCTEPSRLAHLPCAGPAVDRARQSAVCTRPLGARSRCERLRAGLHHHRLVPESVRLGAVSIYEGGRQAAHTARPARLDPRTLLGP